MVKLAGADVLNEQIFRNQYKCIIVISEARTADWENHTISRSDLDLCGYMVLISPLVNVFVDQVGSFGKRVDNLSVLGVVVVALKVLFVFSG